MPSFDELSALARRQHGAFTDRQAIHAGIGRSALQRLCAAGLIERRAPCVYVLAGVPWSPVQDLIVHVLAAGQGALATADSALALWCVELEHPLRPEVAVTPDRRYRTAAAVIRRSSDLSLAKPTVIDGIPVVGIARALLDAAVGRSVEEVLSRIDACRRHRPVAVGALVEALHAHARHGRPGIVAFRGAVQSLRREVTDSDFERFVLRDLRDAGLPEPKLHHVVRAAGEKPIELDLAWSDALLDVELDGRDHTARMLTGRRDRQRDRVLQSIGYRVLRYTWDDYVADRDGMVAEISRFLGLSAISGR